MYPKVSTSAQAKEEELETMQATLKKLCEVMGHHMTGSQGAKKRFEAMMG